MKRTKTITRFRSRPRTHHKKAGLTIPVAVIGGFMPMAFQTYEKFKENGLDGATQALVANTTGYSRWEGKFRLEYLMRGMGPVVAGIFMHKLANRLGVNRALANAGVPLIRI